MKKNKPNPKANRNILLFSYGIVILFLCMAAYFGYFMQVQREDVINNSYNARLDNFAKKNVRGRILADDGTVLAETITNAEGEEVRYYPYGELFAHAVGYSTMGKTGIESFANYYLLTSHENGLQQVFNELAGEKNAGDHVVTTLNMELQTIAWTELGDRRGAVVAMEPATGKILAMVSKPAFDPNLLAQQWEELVNGDEEEAILLNRATQGLYPPGSTFKIITALQYMREHPGIYDQFHYSCDGIYEFESLKIRCYHQTAHGEESFGQAFSNSCNGAFASLAMEMDLNGLRGLAEQLLFNQEQPLAFPYSKSVYQMGDEPESWEILQTAIGQGETLMTPMHNLMVVSAIANDGVLMNPYVIDHVETDSGQQVKKFTPSAYGQLMVVNEANALKELLEQVVAEGTGSALRTEDYDAAGKTGSAEFEKGKETHGWFVGYAPAENPQIAVCVLVEEGGSGGQAAAPIARKLLDAYLIP